MKKKILLFTAMISIVLFGFIGCEKTQIQSEISSSMFLDENLVKYKAKVDSNYFYIYEDKQWKKSFIKGVNIGATKPGYFPGEFGITKEDYLRWFNYISDMNSNTIRVYTILNPEFYNAFYEYNKNTDQPLYLLQGIWINEENIAKYKDAYNPIIVDGFKKDIQTAIDVLHGNKIIKKEPGHAYGTYEMDVSEYVLGYILGIEWDPEFVATTNEKNKEKVSFDGKYLYSVDASPFENFLSETGDYCIEHETLNYSTQTPLSFVNWVTTDVLSHPNEPFYNEDLVSVNTENTKKKESFKTGLFASYHIYPYYPDSLNYQKEYIDFKDNNGNVNTYRAYLKDLKKEHSIPVLVAEFGIPSSRGKAHENIHMGFNQGNVSEEDQGKMDASMIKDIYEESYAGGLIFAFQDEWFKRTWNTMDFDLAHRRPYWNNMQTNEQHFGLLAFDSGKEKSTCYVDGDITDWQESSVLFNNQGTELYMKSDETYVYFMVKSSTFDFDNDTLIIPIDTVKEQGNLTFNGFSFSRAADFLIHINGRENSQILVDPYYDSFKYIYGKNLNMISVDKEYDIKNSGKFSPMYLCLSKELYLPLDKIKVPFSKYETGKLKFGNGNPNNTDYNSLSDFYVKEDIVEIRIPWQLLNVMDPSTKMVMDDLHKDGIKPIEIKNISAGVGILSNNNLNTNIEMNPYELKEWDMPIYHERLKPSYYILKEAFGKYD